jgi:hypothetical protein
MNPHYSWIFLSMNINAGNDELVKLDFARLAKRTGTTKILAELRQSHSHDQRE